MTRKANSDNPQKNLYQSLERQVKGLKMAVLGLAVVLASVLTLAMKDGTTEKILRVQGIIIEDGQGKARMLFGAPFPNVDERKRDDTTVGFVLLDENGTDRISFGYPTLSPQIKDTVVDRINTQAGFIVNDKDGDERTGYGVSDDGLVILGMDYKGQEALLLLADPKGYTGMVVNGEKKPPYHQRVFLGTNNKPGEQNGVFVLNDSEGTARTMFRIKDEKMSWLLLDKDGNIITDAAKNPVK